MNPREFQSSSVEPQFKTQLDALGSKEKVDTSVFNFKVLCAEPGCVQIRYIRSQDRSQVDYCKPHARKHRLESRARRARANRASKRTVDEGPSTPATGSDLYGPLMRGEVPHDRWNCPGCPNHD